MSRKPVALTIGARQYKVVSSADEAELTRLAQTVHEALLDVVPKGRPEPPDALLLAALKLAHRLEEERANARATERRGRDMLRRVLVRLDSVLEQEEPVG